MEFFAPIKQLESVTSISMAKAVRCVQQSCIECVLRHLRQVLFFSNKQIEQEKTTSQQQQHKNIEKYEVKVKQLFCHDTNVQQEHL